MRGYDDIGKQKLCKNYDFMSVLISKQEYDNKEVSTILQRVRIQNREQCS